MTPRPPDRVAVVGALDVLVAVSTEIPGAEPVRAPGAGNVPWPVLGRRQRDALTGRDGPMTAEEVATVVDVLVGLVGIGVADDPAGTGATAVQAVLDEVDPVLEPAARAELDHVRTRRGVLTGERSPAEALATADRWVAALSGGPPTVTRARALAERAIQYEWMGVEAEAERDLDNAEATLAACGGAPAQRGGAADLPAVIALTRANVDMATTRYRDALRRLRDLAAASEAAGTPVDNDWLRSVRLNAATAAAHDGDEAAAVDLILAAGIDPDDPQSTDRPVELCLLAEVALLGRRTDRARRLLDRIDAILPAQPDPDVSWRVPWFRARLDEAGGAVSDAVAGYRVAAELFGAYAADGLEPGVLSQMLREALPLFRAGVRFVGAHGDPSDCAALMDRFKAPSLTGAIARAALVAPADPDGTVRRRTSGAAPPVEKVRAGLAERDQAALTLFTDGTTVTTVLLDSAGASAATVTLPIATRAALDDYCANLVASAGVDRLHDPAALGITADDLVPTDLLDRASAAESLVVVPHGDLHLLPWPSMLRASRTERLFHRCPVGVAPSLGVLDSVARGQAGVPRVALLAPDEPPEAGDEVREVSAVYGDRLVAAPVLGGRATPNALRKLLGLGGRTDVLHLACHAEVDGPGGIRLRLAGGSFDAVEFERTGVPYGDVVLNACNTGWRPRRIGPVELVSDDVIGFVGSVLSGGATALVGSIPPVRDDVARMFALSYQRARHGGNGPLAALRAALLDLEHRLPDAPGQWAGFVVIGAR